MAPGFGALAVFVLVGVGIPALAAAALWGRRSTTGVGVGPLRLREQDLPGALSALGLAAWLVLVAGWAAGIPGGGGAFVAAVGVLLLVVPVGAAAALLLRPGPRRG